MHAIGSLVELEVVDGHGEERLGEVAELDRLTGSARSDMAVDDHAVGRVNAQRQAITRVRSGKSREAHLIDRETEVVGGVTVETGAGRGLPEHQARDAQARGVCREVDLEQIIHGAYGTQGPWASHPLEFG